MFAVGGGKNDVLDPSEGPLCFGVILRTDASADFALGVGVPPYFFSSSWVLLNFVAVLSFSIVASLCF